MSAHTYTEDQLVEQPAIGLFAELGWTTVSALEETFGATGTLLRETKGEAVLVSRLRAASPKRAFRFVSSLGLSLLLGISSLNGATPEPWAAEVSAVFDQLVREQQIIGAQVVVGQNERIRLEHYSGKRFPGRPEAVDADTLFCIGSDSKPMVTGIIMTLVVDGALQLEAPVSKWLPAFGFLKTKDGSPAARSPAVRELMCHRSGIFSQKKESTREQLALIRNFSQTLDQAVRGIAQEPLLTQPGQAYAYSGAGYCVLGRVAELASSRSVEDLLQTRLCRPLQLQHTTYFPANSSNVAVGSRRVDGRSMPDSQAPHLAVPSHRFALVGGSIYSTAQDQARFAQMVLAQGRSGGRPFLPPAVWSEWISRQSPNPDYGLGWSQTFGNTGNEPSRLSHQGALACYRACLVVNLETGFFCAANWTLTGLGSEARIANSIRQVLQKAETTFVK